MDHVMMKFNQDETLLNRCMRFLVNNFNTVDCSRLQTIPKNLLAALFKIISKRGYITDANIQTFLNELTRTLELSECLKLTDDGLNKIIVCKNLIKLDLNSNSIPRTLVTSGAVAQIAQNCRNLKILLLRRCVNLDDKCIDVVSNCCVHLNSINIGNCPLITDNALNSLGKLCKNLKSINVTGTKITDVGIFQLMSMNVSKSIEEIHIAYCDRISDESIECILLNSQKIKYLLFHGCPKITDASRLALEDYMTNNSNQKFQHLTWTVY